MTTISDWTNGVVAIYSGTDPVGTGFVVSAEGLILTCAHVLDQAGWPFQDWSAPVQVRFRANGRFAEALVQQDCHLAQDKGDVALIALQENLPGEVQPLPLWRTDGATGHPAAMWGFPAGFRDGLRGEGSIIGLVPDGKRQALQLRSQETTHGYSGGPVWDRASLRVIGMILRGVEADRIGRLGFTTFAVPAETMHALCPDHLTLLPPAGPAHHITSSVEDLVNSYTEQTFVGRDEALDQLDDWLQAAPSGRLVITAGAGYGKTALMANWLRQRQKRGDAVAYHFFSNTNDFLRPVTSAYESLLAHLSIYYGQSDDAWMRHQSPEAKLSALLAEHRPDPDRRLIILLDALDEADRPFHLPLPRQLLEGVYVVVSARAGDLATMSRIPAYLAGWRDDARPFPLDRLPRSALSTWLRSAGDGALIPWLDDERFVDAFAAATDGLPLFARHLVDDLLALAPDQDPVRFLEQMPPGFEAYIERQVDVLDEQDLADSAYRFLAMLAVGSGPFHKDELKALLGLRDRQLRRLRTSGAVARWLRDLPGDMIAFAHPLIGDSFRLALEDDATEALETLLAWCAGWADDNRPYALRHYADLLSQAARWDELCAVALDSQYARAQERDLSSEPDLPLRTVRLAMDAAGRQRQPVILSRLVLEHARRVLRLRRMSPLTALRAGPGPNGLERARLLAAAYDHNRRVVWNLLLASELADDQRHAEAAAILEDLAQGPLSALNDPWSEPAIWLLSELMRSHPIRAVNVLNGVTGDDQKKTLIESLIAGGRLADAQSVASGITRPEDRVHALLRITRASFSAGDDAAAQALIAQAYRVTLTIDDTYHRRRLLTEVVASQSKAGDKQMALDALAAMMPVARQLEEDGERRAFYQQVALTQIELGDFEAARQTYTEFGQSVSRETILIEMIAAQIRRGEKEAASRNIERFLVIATNEAGQYYKAQLVKRLSENAVHDGTAELSLELARAVEDPWCRAEWLRSLANEYFYADRPAISRMLVDEALPAAQAIGDASDRGAMLCQLAAVLTELREDRLAMQLYAFALAAAAVVRGADEKTELFRRIATNQHYLGYYDEALQSALSIKDSWPRVQAMRDILDAMIGGGKERINLEVVDRIALAAARTRNLPARSALSDTLVSALIVVEDFERALKFASWIEDQVQRAGRLMEIAMVAPSADMRAIVDAVAHLEDREIRQDTLFDLGYQLADDGDPALAQEVFERLGDDEQEQMRSDVMTAWLDAGGFLQAKALADRAPFARDRVENLASIAEAQYESGLADESAATCALALSVAEGIADPEDRALALGSAAATQARNNREEAALIAVDMALAAADQLPEWAEKARVLGDLAIEFAAADFDTAAANALELALEATNKIADAEERADQLGDLAASLHRAEWTGAAERVAGLALRAAGAVDQAPARAEALHRLAEAWADGELIDDAWRALSSALVLHTIPELDDGSENEGEEDEEFYAPWDEYWALKLLEAFESREDLPRVIDMVRQVEHRQFRAWALGQILDLDREGEYTDADLDALEQLDGADLDDDGLSRLARIQGEHQRYAAARRTANQISASWHKTIELGRVAVAQGEGGDSPGALRAVLTLEDGSELESRARDILRTQYLDQGVEAVLQTAALVDDPLVMDNALSVVVGYQTIGGDGDLVAAAEMAGQIQDDRLRDFALNDVAAGRRWAEEWPGALSAAQGIGDLKMKVESIWETILAQAKAGLLEDAANNFTACLEAVGDLEDEGDRMRLLLTMAAGWHEVGQVRHARDAIAVALHSVAGFDDRQPRALALTEIARAEADGGGIEAARVMLRIARDLVWTGEIASSRGYTLYEVALAQAEIGDFAAAQETTTMVQDQQFVYRALSATAAGQAISGDYSAALETVNLIGSKGHRARAHQSIARVQAEAGAFDAAEQTIELIETQANRQAARVELDELRASGGRRSALPPDAADLVNQARHSMAEPLAALIEEAARHNLAGQNQQAEESLATAVGLAADAPDDRRHWKALLDISTAASLLGYEEQARTALTAARAAAGEMDDPGMRRRALEETAVALAATGMGDLAAETAGRIPDASHDFLPDLALTLARQIDLAALNRLLPQCAYDPGTALRACAAIAVIFPEKARAIADLVASYSWD